MIGKMVVINPNGSIDSRSYTAPVPLKDLKEAVQGYIETVPGWDRMGGEPCWVICNEEGKLEGLEPNPFAQSMWLKAAPEYAHLDYLCGPVAILGGDAAFMESL